MASERVVLRGKIEGFRNGPCHVEAITERSIKQMLISRRKFIGFWTENPEFIPGASPIHLVSPSRGEPFPWTSHLGFEEFRDHVLRRVLIKCGRFSIPLAMNLHDKCY